MRPLIVAKKDYSDAIQSRSLWGITAVLVVFTAGLAYSLNEFRLFSMFWPFFLALFGAEGAGSLKFVHFYIGPAQILIPLIALVISYKSIAGEIESGSVKFLLSVPLSRWDALSGKLIGRGAVLSTALVIGLTIAGIVVLLTTGRIELGSYMMVMLFSVIFGLGYISIGVNLSALADSQSRAVIYVVAAYVFLLVIWSYANNIVHFIIDGSFFPPLVGRSGPPDVGGWWYLMERLTPGGAFTGLLREVLLTSPGYHQAFPQGIPFYLESGPLILIMFAWILLPIGVGYYRFDRADIG